MKTLLISLAMIIGAGQSFMISAQESQPSGVESKVQLTAQTNNFKHDHRKIKGQPSTSQSGGADSQENGPSALEPKAPQTDQANNFKHDHRKSKGQPSPSQANEVDKTDKSNKSQKVKVHKHRKTPKS